MSKATGEEVFQLLNRIVTNWDKTQVRAQVNGVWGTHHLSELRDGSQVAKQVIGFLQGYVDADDWEQE